MTALATVVGPVAPASGAPATKLAVVGVADPVVIATPDEIVVRALDGADMLDTGFTGTVNFSADCAGACFAVAVGNTALAGNSYTFVPADSGEKAFNLVWLADAVGERTLTVSAAGLTSAVVPDITVQSNVTTTSSTTTTSTTAPTTTTSAPTTTTTTTPPPPPRGPGSIAVVRPEGGLTGSPDAAAVRGVERVDVVVNRGGEVNRTLQADFGPWQPWTTLGAPPPGLTGDPTIVSWAPGRLDLFARGADDKLWQRFSTDGGASWSDWIKPVGDDGVLASAPTASSRGPGRIDIFVLGTDGRIYERFWDQTQWNHAWLSHGAPAAGVKGPPTSVSWDASRVDIFVRGSDDKLWQRTLSNHVWSAWGKPVGNDGTLASSPEAASWAPGVLLVFVRGTDGRAYVLPYGGVWGGWIFLVGGSDQLKEGSKPGATSRGTERFDLFMRGLDDRLFHIWQ